MGRSKKRHAPDQHRRSTRDFGVADAHGSVKRRRLSHDASNDDFSQPSGVPSDIGRRDDEGWQTVVSKSSRKGAKSRDSYPQVTFDRKLTRPIIMEQLRDLVLYVLADGMAPSWVAVNKAKSISKVVVLMVPGLDNEFLKKSKLLLKSIRTRYEVTSTKNGGKDGISNAKDNVQSSTEDSSTSHDILSPNANSSHTDIVPINSRPTDIESLLNEDSVNLLHDILDESIPVKAPGDAKFSKVHSSLQAILMVPQTSTKANERQPPERSFKPVATSITHFIQSSDELREAEYPIHPSSFTSAADAALEKSRREGTGQSEANGWVNADVTESSPVIPPNSDARRQDPASEGLDIYAIDCEMVLTTDQNSSLARLSVVSWPDGKVIIDKYVKPDLPIENYFTQYSGITPKILENVTTRLSDVQQDLSKLLTASTILLGHSLESDLNALKMTHPFIIDTSMAYPHPRGLPLRSSLKFLANKYLRREIQMGGANGHDSVEDARAVLDLVKLKCEKGPKFGTTEANGEPIFKRLSRHKNKDGTPLTSAIVEYGSSPERGLGKDATYAIGCQNDEDVTTGMIRAINGDKDGKDIPAGGADFVWGRLRSLEFARGWVTNTNANVNAGSTTSTDVENKNPTDQAQDTQGEIDIALLATLSNIARIRDALPPTTLFMICSGTADVRPVLKLQAVQSQYRKEFKVKKWNELTVRWTDTEEQALRNAVDRAREGWGWVGII